MPQSDRSLSAWQARQMGSRGNPNFGGQPFPPCNDHLMSRGKSILTFNDNLLPNNNRTTYGGMLVDMLVMAQQEDYGHPYDYPFDPFQSAGRGCPSHRPARACEQDPFESINRQFGQPPCPGSFTPPPPTVFHGHHAQFGPVYRSHSSSMHSSSMVQVARSRYYIERNGTLTEVSGDIFHELRCESGKMTCCAPHCDEHMYHGRQQGITRTTTAPVPTHGRAAWPPPSQHEDTRARGDQVVGLPRRRLLLPRRWHRWSMVRHHGILESTC